MVEGTLEDVKVGTTTAFGEMERGEVREYVGVEVLVRLQTTDHRLQVKQVPIYIIDNHNHALYCWYREFLAGRFQKWIKLIHIDQHSDMKEPVWWIDSDRENDLWYIAQYTNEVCTIADFIEPALRSGLVGECVQVRTESGLLEYVIPSPFVSTPNLPPFGSPLLIRRDKKEDRFSTQWQGYILDIDVDFWAVEMGIVEFDRTIKKTRALVQGACVVTIATSPHFMNQKRAVEIVKKFLAMP